MEYKERIIVSMIDISVKETLQYLRQENYNNLAFLLEETWRRHPDKSHDKFDDKHYEMWEEQVALNLPILYLASICLHSFVEEHNIKNLLFATRDCTHWHKIYKAMYPNDNVHYFHCSRNMFNLARRKLRLSYENYIDTITEDNIHDTVYIDIHGTGKRMHSHFKHRGKGIPACFILSSGHSTPNNLSSEIKRLIKKGRCEFIVFNANGSPIEMLNYDVIGTCNDYNKYGPIRASLEYDKKYVETYHECVDYFIKIIKRNSSMDDNNHSLNCRRKIIKYLFRPALHDLPIVSNWIRHERRHIK